ncbi:MAG: hypothetical protein V2A76_01250 [Planctomycetota bacterium]
MKSRVLTRFLLVLGVGLILVWIFGIDSDEGLLGRKSERVKVSEEEAAAAAKARRDPDSDVAVTGALIPVREELSDEPGVMVRKYTVRIGYTASGNSKRMHAEEVAVDIFNGKAPPEERRIALIHGDEALIYFDSAPDAANGFKGAAITSMTLMKNVVVEYLDKDGVSLSELHSETLDLSDERFYVEGHAVILQEGLRVEGDELTYLKSDGSFSLERNVVVEGTRFALPSPDSGKADSGVELLDPAGEDGTAALKTITCDGRFTFVPEEAAEEAEEVTVAAPDDTQVAQLGGGLLTFRENVVGAQGETELSCDTLEITLASLPAAEAGGKKKLEVSHVLATGSVNRPATMTAPEGTLLGETVTLVKTDAGQVITLEGEPRILNARMGGSESGDGGSVFSAGAKSQIRFRPAPAPEAPPEGEAATAPAEESIVLELIEDAYLQTESEGEGDNFRIEGQKCDLEFARLPPDASDPEAKSGYDLRQLLATGYPRVVMNSAAEAGGVPTDVTIQSLSNLTDLTYTPAAPGQETKAVFRGETELEVKEDGVVTTKLTSNRQLTILLGVADEEGGKGGFSSLVAEGEVVLENQSQNVHGTGDKMTLFPVEEGGYRLQLAGIPGDRAVATAGAEGEDRKVISGLLIDFDPKTGTLHATGQAPDQVEAHFAGLDFASDFGAAREEGAPSEGQGLLLCDDLSVLSGEEGAPPVVDATGNVAFDDPSRDISATCHRLYYEESLGVARLYGNEWKPATLTRSATPKNMADPSQEAAAPPRTVSISGPLLLLEKETGTLTCPDRGIVTMLSPGQEGGGKAQKITARSKGQIRYFQDRLVLHQEVVIGFEEDDSEIRALWCDVATVFFSDSTVDEEQTSGIGDRAGGFDRIVADGRVHLEQIAPKDLIAEGQKLVWIRGTDDEVMFLSGTNPQCWVVGLLGDKNVRDEADWFRLYRNSNEVQAENGRTVLLQEVSQR